MVKLRSLGNGTIGHGEPGYAMGPGSAAELRYLALKGSIQKQALGSIVKSGHYRIIIMTSNGIAVYERNENGTRCG